MKELYVVLQTIWHSGEEAYRHFGDVVSLDHLSPADREVLVERDIVAQVAATELEKKVEPEKAKAEVK